MALFEECTSLEVAKGDEMEDLTLAQKLRMQCKFHRGHLSRLNCLHGLDTRQFDWRNSPCTKGLQDGVPVCESAEYMTEKEAEQQASRVAKDVEAFVAFCNKSTWICPHCGAKIREEEQVGRCAYARPCGCRLFQGKARGLRPLHWEYSDEI